MSELKENSNATPILDNFLINFHLKDDKIPMQITFFDEERQQIKAEIDEKARGGTLTKTDIEVALQRMDITRGCCAREQTKSFVEYLARNYKEIFIRITGHNPF